jgi:hypothetical protein
MANKSKTTTSSASFKEKAKVSRPGVHSKTKSSKSKASKNYTKTYKGQGK